MKLLIFLSLILISTQVNAKIVARVLDITGNAFVFNEQGNAKTLAYSSQVSDFSEVMVEDGSRLVLLNSQGHKLFINGGSLLKLYHGILEVKKGKVWIKAKDGQGPGIVQTTNALGRYGAGEFILSFDNDTSKAQLLVLDGEVHFSNIIEPDLGVKVGSGKFSLIQNEKEDGLPRFPTQIGNKSYKAMKGQFAAFKSLNNNDWDHVFDSKVKKKIAKRAKLQKRGIASVDVQDQFSDKKSNKGKVIFIRTINNKRVPASVDSLGYYKEKLNEQVQAKKPVKTYRRALIRVFGKPINNPAKSAQAPATSKDSKASVKKASKSRLPASSSAGPQNELDMLIQDLQSYSSDDY